MKYLALISLVISGCSDLNFSMEKSDDTGGGWYDHDESNTSTDQSDTGTDDWEPETEEDFRMLMPAETDSYVFVANPDRGTVTRVSVPSLDVITVSVGENPTVVKTTSDYTKAIAFNKDSDDVSIIDAETLDVVNVAVRPNLNAMSMSPDGQWVICFRDADIQEEESQSGVESYNEISLVNTETYEHYPMVVGFNPRQVKYTDQSDIALVVSDEYVAVLDLTTVTPTPSLLQIAEDLLNAPIAEEIEITPNGDYAFIRQFQATDLVILDLATIDVGRVEVGYNPTDLDIMPDGEYAAVVARGDEEVWLYQTSEPFNPPIVLDLPEGEVLGSVLFDPSGKLGILYTTATLTDRYATWNLETDEITVRSFVKPVDNMAVSPTGESLLVFHTQSDASDGSTSSTYSGEYALTLMSLNDFRQNPLRLPSEPIAYSQSDSGEFGFFIMEDENYLEVLDYVTLLATPVDLKSKPLHIGVLPDTDYCYVSQEHSLGRISFYESTNKSLETITGFELNGEIEH